MPIEPTTDDEEPCVATTPSSFAEALAGVRPEIKSSNGRRVREKKEKCVTHVCITCRMGFASFSNLKTHLRVHSGDKPYSCDTCGKAFAQASHLTKHLRVHSGDKPYSCDTCGKAFSTSANRNTHFRVHSGLKPYSCDTCGKAFTQSGHLSRHLRARSGCSILGLKVPPPAAYSLSEGFFSTPKSSRKHAWLSDLACGIL
jgi:DNA-directed RNA polymerase subunit RPC12/RpoP